MSETLYFENWKAIIVKEDDSLKIDEEKNVAKLNDVFSNVIEYLGVITFAYYHPLPENVDFKDIPYIHKILLIRPTRI